MPQPPQSTVDKVRRRLVDISESNPILTDFEALHEAINSALTHYSKDQPRSVTQDVAGAGSSFYALTGVTPVLSPWSDGYSIISSIEYPASAVAAGYTPSFLTEQDDWRYYLGTSIKYLWFISVQPAVGETMRITYTALHTHTTSADTVPVADLDALCDLSAHYACMALATKMAASQDSLISADSVNYRDGQLRFKQQAEAWLTSYNRRMGISTDSSGGGTVKGGSANADWDQTYQNGLPFLIHWGRRR